MAGDGLERFPRDLPTEEWNGGINPYSMFSFWRGYCLIWLGRRSDGLKDLYHCCKLANEDGSLELVGYALVLAAEAHYYGNEAEDAKKCAHLCEENCSKLGDPANMVATKQLSSGYAHLAAGRAADAIAPARAALNLHGSTENEMTGWSSTLLAEALLASGEIASAVAAAEKAIILCERSQRMVFQAIAHLILARAILQLGSVNAQVEVAAALDKAEKLIECSGARSLSPPLLELRAEQAATLGNKVGCKQLLEQAVQGYQTIGAPRQAERLVATS